MKKSKSKKTNYYKSVRLTPPGRRLGLFLGGVAFGLIRGIFFKNKY